MTLIVLGADGSRHSAAATAFAARLAVALDATVVAVHAAGLLEHLRGDPEGAHLLPMLQEWTAVLDDLPPERVRRRIEVGEPVFSLLQVAAEEAADVLVVGTRGAGDHAPAMLGSVSHQLAERSPCPLVIVPLPRSLPGSETPPGMGS